jgi:hypothetical protein
MLEERIRKYNIKVEEKEIGFVEEILHRVENRGVKLEELFPKEKTNNGVIDYGMFWGMVREFWKEKDVAIEN